VTPRESLFDVATRIVVNGLTSGQQVAVEVTSTDAHGVRWASSASYVADRLGVVDIGRTAARSGSYLGVDPMGPFDFLAPVETERPLTGYMWPLSSVPLSFKVTVSFGGRVLATRQVERTAAVPGETVRPLTLAKEGFFGYLYQPPPSGEKHAAVLIFGGSEGGDHATLAASLLAAHGYPALALAYFREPGLPQTLSNIPLEYFIRAIGWLARQPDVNPARIFVSGASRGSEAALLLASHFPSLVYGAIANVPSNVAYGCIGCPGGPAWTLHGQPIPYATFLPGIRPTYPKADVIPVENIRGPVFLDCGGADKVWFSCPATKAIAARLRTFHRANHLVIASYPSGGHGVGGLVPHEAVFPGTDTRFVDLEGVTPTANSLARADLWPRLLAFLHRYG